jgi:signal transduction histidine kinase
MAAIAAPVETSVDEVLVRIAEVARQLTGAEYCALGIGTDPGEQFHPWVFSGMTDEQARDIGRTPRPVCLLGAVPREGRTIRLADLQSDRRHCGFPPHHPTMRSFLGVPIRMGGRSLGNLYLTNKTGDAEFGEEDQLLVEALAVHAAVAVESARLYGEAHRRAAELEEERRQRETFISVISHELRGPIAVLMGYADLLPDWDRIPADRRARALRAIGDQTRQMNRLIGDLLDVSRIQTGRFAIDEESVDLSEVVHGVVSALQATAPDRDIQVDAPDQLVLMADRGRIAQALGNLVSNALKYSPMGGPVRVKLRREDGGALVSVADEGVGIAPEQMSQLFRPYSRLFRERHVGKGVGLGLFITKGIVEAHGGHIWAESAGPGRGTTFRFTLPADEGERKADDVDG